MSRIRTDGVASAALAGVQEDAAMPVRVDAGALATSPKAITNAGSLMRGALRAVRYAAVAVVLMAAVPLGLATMNGHRLLRATGMSFYIKDNTAVSNVVRAFVLPTDASITPTAAGIAFAALQPAKSSPGFTPRPAPVLDGRWRDAPLSADMFLAARPDVTPFPAVGGIMAMAVRGFNAQEMSYLRTIAAAPVWRDYDIVAHAKSVDILGGQFQLPFGDDASVIMRPVTYKGVRELAYAAVARSAYHLAMGQRDSAEAALRAIISVGFAMMDNGTAAMDEMIGTVIVGIGREGLRNYYAAIGDPRSTLPALVKPARAPGRLAAFSNDEWRAKLVSRVADPRLPRAERLEALSMLSFSTCSNVSEILTGPRPEIKRAFQVARHDLVRFPSEQAIIDVMERANVPLIDEVSYNPFTTLAVSAATVPGVVLGNPRLAACTRLLAW